MAETKPTKGPVANQSREARIDNERDRDLVNMEQAIALLKTTRTTFYRWLRSGKLKGMKVGRQWRFYRDDIDRFLRGAGPRIELKADIQPLIDDLLVRLHRVDVEEPESLPHSEPIERAVSLMIALAANLRASDIHLDPFRSMGSLRFRIDGMLTEITSVDLRLMVPLVEQWKVLAACDPHEQDKIQEGRIELRTSQLGMDQPDGQFDLRVTVLPSGRGEAVTARVLNATAICLDLDLLGFGDHNLNRLRRALSDPWGLIVCAGATGSGKTTSLYACLNELNRFQVKLFSVESPVEVFIDGAVQIPINPAAGVTYDRAVKSVLRADPDVILIGEIRDGETLLAGQRAALTGHLVMTALHTKDAASTVKRLLDMSSDPFVVGDSTSLVLAQRLMRKLCPHCAVDTEPTPDRLDLSRKTVGKGGLEWASLPAKYRQPVGCDRCARTGFRGLVVIAETLEITPEMRRVMERNPSEREIRDLAVQQGMITLGAHAFQRAANGETSLEEAARAAGLV